MERILTEEDFIKAAEMLGYKSEQVKEHIEYCNLVYYGRNCDMPWIHFYDFFKYPLNISQYSYCGPKGGGEKTELNVIPPYSLSRLRLYPKELEKLRNKVNKQLK